MARKQKKYHFFYKATNIVNNKFYIGMHSTDNLKDGYLGSGIKLKNSVRYHGKKNHKIEILEFFNTRKKLIEGEIEIINGELLSDPLCMNLHMGGQGFPLGGKHSEKTKKKISKSRKGKASGKDNWIYGKKHSQESIKKMKDNATILYGEDNGFYRKTHTEETKDKIRKSRIGKKASKETKEKMKIVHNRENNGFYGKSHSEEFKNRMSELNRGKIPGNAMKVGYGHKIYNSIRELFNKEFSKNVSYSTFHRRIKKGKIVIETVDI